MTLVSFIRRHPVACFFVLAYFLTWGAIPWNSFFTPGALIAAVVVILATEGPRGLLHLGSRLIRWRVSWVWYALAIGVPLFVHFASTSVNAALGTSAPSLSMLTPWYGVPLAVAIHAISPLHAPLMEEPSFRGFAQPELQRSRSPLAATAIMAVLVTGWHAPLFFMPVRGLTLRPDTLKGRLRSCRVAHALILLSSLYHLAGSRLIAAPSSSGPS